jgi:hypothetical protein
MARPPLPVGTHGKITVHTAGRARCRYRHYDGRVYPVERYAATRTKAELRLREAIRDWTAPATGTAIGPQTRFSDVGRTWMAELERDAEQGLRSWGTVDTYRLLLSVVAWCWNCRSHMDHTARAGPASRRCSRVTDLMIER